jgi:hypothetical protein
MYHTPPSASTTFEIAAPLAAVFPCFTALGERAWAPGWEPELLSGREQRGSAFRTRADDRCETLWVVTDYRPDLGRVSYARVALGRHVGLVDVACQETGRAHTQVTVTYTLTPLGAEAEAAVVEFLEPPAFAAYVGTWQPAISAALGVSG